jgi:Fic family protein
MRWRVGTASASSRCAALRVHHELLRRPVATSRTLEKQTGLSHVTVNKTLDHLCRLGLTRELTGHTRNRVFSYTAYLAILNEGTEPIGDRP